MISSDRHIIFKIENYSVITRLIEAEFMNYRASIPKVCTTEIRINTDSIIKTVERMSLLLTDKMKSPIRCYIDNDTIRTSCETPLGKATDQINAKIQGEPVEIGFNNNFLLDAFRHTESDEVMLKMTGALNPMTITPTEGDSFLFLLLPMRLSR